MNNCRCHLVMLTLYASRPYNKVGSYGGREAGSRRAERTTMCRGRYTVDGQGHGRRGYSVSIQRRHHGCVGCLARQDPGSGPVTRVSYSHTRLPVVQQRQQTGRKHDTFAIPRCQAGGATLSGPPAFSLALWWTKKTANGTSCRHVGMPV